MTLGSSNKQPVYVLSSRGQQPTYNLKVKQVSDSKELELVRSRVNRSMPRNTINAGSRAILQMLTLDPTKQQLLTVIDVPEVIPSVDGYCAV